MKMKNTGLFVIALLTLFSVLASCAIATGSSGEYIDPDTGLVIGGGSGTAPGLDDGILPSVEPADPSTGSGEANETRELPTEPTFPYDDSNIIIGGGPGTAPDYADEHPTDIAPATDPSTTAPDNASPADPSSTAETQDEATDDEDEGNSATELVIIIVACVVAVAAVVVIVILMRKRNEK